MKLLLCLLFYFLKVVQGQVYEIELIKNANPTDFYTVILFNFTLGDPPQPFNGYLHSLFEDLIVTDVQCGIRPSDCPRYCEDRRHFQSKHFHSSV